MHLTVVLWTLLVLHFEFGIDTGFRICFDGIMGIGLYFLSCHMVAWRSCSFLSGFFVENEYPCSCSCLNVHPLSRKPSVNSPAMLRRDWVQERFFANARLQKPGVITYKLPHSLPRIKPNPRKRPARYTSPHLQPHHQIHITTSSTHQTAAMPAPPLFWSQPIRYMRYAAHTSPAIFYSIVIGGLGPVLLVTVPPIRKALGYEDDPMVPRSYPSE